MIKFVTKIITTTLFVVTTSSVASADDSRYIIQVGSSNKGIVKALAVQMGGTVQLDAKGFIAATFKGKSLNQVKGLLNNPHIQLIENDLRRYPQSLFNDDLGNPATQQLIPYSIKQSQADQLTLQLGQGQKVCIIDSGIAGSSGETGGANTDFNWGNITGDSDSGTGDWNTDGGPHGTHVAGIVAAVDNGIGVIGMTPGVPLHIIKVFNEAGWGYSSDLAYAADLCAQAGANIITMSLGGGGANSTEESAFNTFTDSGGLVLAAAGNDGNNVRSYPAGYKSVMMIGANDADNNIASFSQFPSNTVKTGRGKNKTTETDDGFGVEVTAGGVDVLSTYPSGAATLSTLSADGAGYASSAMENISSASAGTYFMGTAEATDSAASGKVCVIDRGNISFHDKVLNCESSGGLGAIIINNEPGILYGTLGTPNATVIPAVGASLEDRDALIAATTATISVDASDYGYMSGTSMSTPAVAGIAALIWSNNPSCTGADVRQALKDSAQDQGTSGRDDYFGYGIVKAPAANSFLATNSCGANPNANVVPTAEFTGSCTRLNCSFNASGSSDSDGSIAAYSWDFGDNSSASGVITSYSYSPAGTYKVTLTVTDDDGAVGRTFHEFTVSDGIEPPAADITLSATRSINNREITINWTGAQGGNVDVYVNDTYNNTTSNDGSNTYRVNKNGTYSFKVCEQGSTTIEIPNCSNTVGPLAPL